MTRIGGGQRAHATVPLAQAPKTTVVQAQVTHAAPTVERRAVTQDDRHGAASRAFDDGQAKSLQAKVGGAGEGPSPGGFGVNAGDRPLRTMPGSPLASAWGNAGHGIVCHLTVHAPTGRIVEAQSLARAAAACALVVNIFGGPRSVGLLAAAVAGHPAANLGTEGQHQDLQGLGQRAMALGISFEELVRMQTLLAAAANLSQPLLDAVRSCLVPQTMRHLARPDVAELRRVEQALVAGQEPVLAQPGALEELLGAVLQRRVALCRAWDPEGVVLQRSLRCRMGPAAWETAPAGVEDVPVAQDHVAVLAHLAGMLVEEQQHVAVDVDAGAKSPLPGLLEGMGAGGAVLLQVHRSDKAQDPAADRVVAVGRRKDGMAYIYNPDPRNGDATLVFGRVGRNQAPEFQAQLARISSRLRPDVDGRLPSATRVRALVS